MCLCGGLGLKPAFSREQKYDSAGEEGGPCLLGRALFWGVLPLYPVLQFCRCQAAGKKEQLRRRKILPTPIREMHIGTECCPEGKLEISEGLEVGSQPFQCSEYFRVLRMSHEWHFLIVLQLPFAMHVFV